MFRIIAARSLKFSEHRDSRANQEHEEDVEVNKNNQPQNKNNDKKQLGGQNKLRKPPPDIVSNVIQREADKSKRTQHGVWSSVGIPYVQHGIADLELGRETMNDVRKKLRKQHKLAEGSEVNHSSPPPSQKLATLVTLFDATRAQLWAEGGGPNGSSAAQPSLDAGSSSETNPPSAHSSRAETATGVAPADSLEDLQAAEGNDNRNWDDMKVSERLGSLTPSHSLRRENHSQATRRENRSIRRPTNHLIESNYDHLVRWRSKFNEKEEISSFAMLDKVLRHQEAKDLVSRDGKLFANAMYLAQEKERIERSPQHFRINSNARLLDSSLSLYEKAPLVQYGDFQHDLNSTFSREEASGSEQGASLQQVSISINLPPTRSSPSISR
jgi:hypothetical protein